MDESRKASRLAMAAAALTAVETAAVAALRSSDAIPIQMQSTLPATRPPSGMRDAGHTHLLPDRGRDTCRAACSLCGLRDRDLGAPSSEGSSEIAIYDLPASTRPIKPHPSAMRICPAPCSRLASLTDTLSPRLTTAATHSASMPSAARATQPRAARRPCPPRTKAPSCPAIFLMPRLLRTALPTAARLLRPRLLR